LKHKPNYLISAFIFKLTMFTCVQVVNIIKSQVEWGIYGVVDKILNGDKSKIDKKSPYSNYSE